MRSFLFAIFIIIFWGCKENKIKEELIPIDYIVEPSDLHLMQFGKVFNGEIFPSTDYDYKIITRINGDCLPCIMEMGNWQVFHHKVCLKYGVRLVFYVYSQYNYQLFNKTMNSVLYSGLPIYQDSTDLFMTINSLDSYNNTDCFLVKNDSVILMGNPIRDKNVYNKIVDILKKNGQPFFSFDNEFE